MGNSYTQLVSCNFCGEIVPVRAAAGRSWLAAALANGWRFDSLPWGRGQLACPHCVRVRFGRARNALRRRHSRRRSDTKQR